MSGQFFVTDLTLHFLSIWKLVNLPQNLQKLRIKVDFDKLLSRKVSGKNLDFSPDCDILHWFQEVQSMYEKTK